VWKDIVSSLPLPKAGSLQLFLFSSFTFYNSHAITYKRPTSRCLLILVGSNPMDQIIKAEKFSAADTIRIMVSTDNHVGYGERDPTRGDDSWNTFDEIMTLARERDVDMVLLAGDLFHDNKPSRKAMYHVMSSLRKNCFGEKPCELEMLSDASEAFQGAFNHVNYEDPDINVAIPVFSIHGNHDDPTGDGHLASLDLLQMAGMVNYYGRTPESDNISIKPVLLQKGRTKLALYGMSNVRDERMFRTFRDQKVKFYQPGTQTGDWFNLMSVHQNHHAYTETGYLPENFLPSFMDLVIWGHEHECLINPRYNPEQTFHVMQPGSSVATSLMPGEAVPKHVAILSITGKEFKCEPIRLKTVRPFVMREIVLMDDAHMKKIAMKDDNRAEITRYLTTVVEDMIREARQAWREAQEGEIDEDQKPELPLIRLRVEYSAPEGGRFDCENPQRFSNRFLTKVANVNDVVQFHRKKTGASRKKEQPDMPDESILQQMTIDTVKVEKLVKEFLTAQSLTILPQNSFGDAVSQFVNKDDKHAMEAFVNESLASQLKNLLAGESVEDEDMIEAMEGYKTKLEEMFAKGTIKRPTREDKLKPKPANWDSDLDGEWAAQPGAMVRSDEEAEDDEEEEEAVKPKPRATRGRGGKATGTTRKTAAATKKAAPAKKTTTRAKKAPILEESDDDEDDFIMLDDDDDEIPDVNDDEDDDDEDLFVKEAPKKRAPAKAAAKSTAKRAASPPKRKAPARSTAKATTSKQTTLSFSQTPAPSQPRTTATRAGRKNAGPVSCISETIVTEKLTNLKSEDEISDDDDAFEPPPTASRPAARRKF
jgi:double-strand break repair protein MRE11